MAEELMLPAETPAPPAPRWLRVLRGVLAALLTLAALGWAGDIYRTFGVVLLDEQFNAVVLALALALVYVSKRARRSDVGPPPWYDVCAALIGFAAAAYVAWDYTALTNMMALNPPRGVAIGGILLALVLEGLRRASGNVLVGILAVFILYGFFGQHVPGALQGRAVDPPQLLLYLSLDLNGVFGSVFGVAATIVISFLFFGALLERTGGARFFTDMAVAAFGRFRGGAAKIAVVASSMFGTINGNAVANVAATGVVTIPMMKEAGYRREVAAAIEAVASTGGQLMPPVMGAAAFIMAELLGIAYSEIVIAAVVPALLYYGALFIQADLEAAKHGIAAVPRSKMVPIKRVLTEGWYFPIPFAVIVFGLFSFNLSPETAALYASLALIACELVKRLELRHLVGALVDTGIGALDILMIAAAAGFIIGILNVTGLGFALTVTLVQVGAGSAVLLLILAALISIVLGMGMPTTAVYLLLAALVAPSLTEVGIPPLAAHLFVLYFGMMSMTTPPVAVAAFAAATIARADPMKTGFAGVRFGWSAYIVPFLFVASPTLLMQGSAPDVALAAATAIYGVYLVSVGVAGFMTRPIGPLIRILFVASGIALMVPAQAFPGALWTDIAGFVAGSVLILSELGLVRRRFRARQKA
jgi:TRAP transporter 4TM/12TM fusion protein